MKKLLVLAVALLLVPGSAMAGMTAFMDMDELSSTEMASTTGQAGIDIATSLVILSTSGSYVGWGDSDGYGVMTTAGWVTLQDMGIGGLTFPAADPLTVDACSDGLGKSWIVLGIGSLTLDQSIGQILVGSAVSVGDDMGAIQAHIVIDNATVMLSGH